MNEIYVAQIGARKNTQPIKMIYEPVLSKI
jgi:hypothetical protein